jgi:hypothetical protein
MHAVDLVQRDILTLARSTAERTTSPYFGQALLRARLGTLRGRIERLAQVNRAEFTALAEHLDVPPTVPEVLAEVERAAQRLLAALQTPQDRHQSFNCSP